MGGKSGGRLLALGKCRLAGTPALLCCMAELGLRSLVRRDECLKAMGRGKYLVKSVVYLEISVIILGGG